MTSAINFLVDHNIPFRLFQHNSRPTSLAQAAIERGQLSEQIVRSILFRIKENDFVMVLIPGPSQISWKFLRNYLSIRRVSLATLDEVLAITGYAIGAVSPFGLLQPTRILVDSNILNHQEISIGSGQHSVAIILKSTDLFAALSNAEMLNLSEIS